MAQLYELMIVFHPGLDVSDEKSVRTLLSGLLGDKVNIDEISIWGKKALAYEIKKQKEGSYVLSRLSTREGFKIAELENKVKLNEKVLRYLFTLVK